jgi:hypothetical protein
MSTMLSPGNSRFFRAKNEIAGNFTLTAGGMVVREASRKAPRTAF